MSLNPKQINIISVLPKMFAALNYGVLGRALEANLLTISCWDPRGHTANKHRNIDDKPYGGGPGMVMMVEPLRKTLQQIQKQAKKPNWVIYLSPQGQPLHQRHLAALGAKLETHCLTFLCGRYEGIDERVIEGFVDEEYSIGDYVLSGGEFAAMVMIDALARLIPGVLGDPLSAEQDSFCRGLLEYPQYTRPENDQGLQVPQVLLSGDHQAIARWRSEMALKRTVERRPDLLNSAVLTEEEKKTLARLLAAGDTPQSGLD